MTCRLQEACCPVNGEEIVQITNMDLIQLLPSMEHPHWNSSSSSSSSCTSNSAKDTTTNTTTCPKSQQTMASSRNEFSSNQSDRRQRSKQQQPSYCLKKGEYSSGFKGGGGGSAPNQLSKLCYRPIVGRDQLIITISCEINEKQKCSWHSQNHLATSDRIDARECLVWTDNFRSTTATADQPLEQW